MPDFYQEFFYALRGPGPTHPNGVAPAIRFEVYRNNVHSSLVNALAEAYPVVQRLVGEEFFRAMAADFVRVELPTSPLLLEYGEGFAAFIDAFEPVAGLPYLGDIARLEWARQQAYHAAEAEPLQAQRLSDVEPTQLGDLRLQMHPSLRVCESRWPVLDIWATNARDVCVRAIDLDAGGQQVLIVRPGAQLTEQLLPAGGAQFLAAIAAGKTLAESAETALTGAADFKLAGLLKLLLQTGALADFELADCEPAARTDRGNTHD
jgi:hypothetical protein